VWELTLRTITGILRSFEGDMKAEGPSLPSYDVLVQLMQAPEKRLRMQDLADAVIVTRTRSGLSRLIDRMEEAGLVRREPAMDDRRGSYAVLTDEGRASYERLALEHQGKIEERFTMHKLGSS
jgi:DNA-binding MarR family transcriptional regulator